MGIYNKLTINNCSLICVDCVDINRAIKSIDICKNKCNFSDIKLLTSISSDYQHSVNIDNIENKKQYSYFMIKKLIDYISTDYILIIQHDSWIVDENKWNNEWYKYDYMGALIPAWEDVRGGNGGFSFRSKNLLKIGKEIIPENMCHPEDVAYSASKYNNKKNCIGFREDFETYGLIFSDNRTNLIFGGIHARKYKESFGHHRAKFI